MKTSVMEVHDMLSVFSIVEVEKRIGEVFGVESVTVNFAAGNAPVRFDETRLEKGGIKSAVRQGGFEPATPGDGSPSDAHESHEAAGAPPTAATAAPLSRPAAPTAASTGAHDKPPAALVADEDPKQQRKRVRAILGARNAHANVCLRCFDSGPATLNGSATALQVLTEAGDRDEERRRRARLSSAPAVVLPGRCSDRGAAQKRHLSQQLIKLRNCTNQHGRDMPELLRRQWRVDRPAEPETKSARPSPICVEPQRRKYVPITAFSLKTKHPN